MKKLFLLLISCFFLSCTRQHYSQEIETVLQQAGDNRSELEQVLTHYSESPADSLKLKAAEFLIVNMPGKYSEYYDAPWNDVATVNLRWTSSSDKQMVLDTYKLGKPIIKEDIKYITADYLINNIDLAFKVWKEQPWGKHISFDTFCEEILPYRVNNEPLENWREKALASYADPYNDLRKDSTITAVEACTEVNKLLPAFRMDKDFSAMNYSMLMASTRGSCDEMAALTVFVMRALGIPVSIDFTPQWSDQSYGHSWNSVSDSDGRHISFMGTETNPHQSHVGLTRTKSKTYRTVFSNQHKIQTENEHIPPMFRNKSFMDVSSEYTGCTDLEIPIKYKQETATGYAYLAGIYNLQWNIIASGRVEGNVIKYASVGKEVMYLPVWYANNVQLPAGDPFVLDSSGHVISLKPDSPDSLLLFYAITPVDDWCQIRMLYGEFEGANKSDFSDAKILHRITTLPKPATNTVILKTNANYRYIRYKSPNNGYCNVAEICFYNADGEKLIGKHIGTQEAWNNTMTGDKAFDGDVLTYFTVNEWNSSNAWTGLDLQEKKNIQKIQYIPRNNGNGIYQGHEYELFHWNKNKWQSLGKQTPVGTTLQYRAPSESLFCLRNITLDRSGIMFMVGNEIHWW